MMRRLAILCGLTAAMGIVPAPASALSLDAVQARLLREMRLAGPSAGAAVVDLTSGVTLFGSRPDVRRAPASVNKLFTTSTALLALGPDATLDTDVLASVPPNAAGVIDGDLYLRGAGDPTLTTAAVGALATRLATIGRISRVRGSVIGDESAFDQRRGSYDSGYALDSEIEGQLGALVVDRGYARRRFQARPALYAAQRLVGALRARHVTVTGATTTGTTPVTATVVDSTPSPPISSLIARTNAPSDNYLAETLLKVLGARLGGAGTTPAGAGVVRAQLARLGVAATVVDGSGLSRADQVAPRQVVNLLRAVDAAEQGPLFAGSLALAGRSGTLAKRMRGTSASGACRAKTGTLRGVSGLAGICDTPTGDRVAFAFLMNGVNIYAARRLQDRMTVALAQYAAAPR